MPSIKGVICVVVVLLLIFLAPNISAEIVINEFEQNPTGTDTGNEWVELYSDSEINLEGWKLVNADDDTFTLNGTINGYLVVHFSSQWLDNSDEKVILMNNESIIDETPLLSDGSNNDNAWSFCKGEWEFVASTLESVNECAEEQQEDEEQEEQEEPENEEPEPEPEEQEPPPENLTDLPSSASITEKPSEMKFGEIAIVKAKFSSEENYEKLLFLLYSAPKRVVRDLNEEIITPNKVEASTAVEARAYKGEEIEFSLPLNLFDNCDKYYEDGRYDIFLKGFYFGNEWKTIGDLASFSLQAEYNKELCEGTKSTKTSAGEQTESPNKNENTKTITGATSKTATKTTTPASLTLYLSKSKIIKNIGLWILIALTIWLIYLIWKKKLI